MLSADAGRDDFEPDPAGLREALELLLAARSDPGSPHVDRSPDTVPLDWPQSGIGGRAALRALVPVGLDQAVRLDHPGFLAHMDPPTPWMTWAASMWAAAMNQNVLHPDAGPAARDLERTVIDWLAPAFGMRGGHLVPGSTVANLTALWSARELTGARRVVCSAAAHLSIRVAFGRGQPARRPRSCCRRGPPGRRRSAGRGANQIAGPVRCYAGMRRTRPSSIICWKCSVMVCSSGR